MLNEKNLTPELLEKAKSATSATALLAFAQENDIALTTEEAADYYTKLHPEEGALSDEELDNVAGGGICENLEIGVLTECPNCRHPKLTLSWNKKGLSCKKCGWNSLISN